MIIAILTSLAVAAPGQVVGGLSLMSPPLTERLQGCALGQTSE